MVLDLVIIYVQKERIFYQQRIIKTGNDGSAGEQNAVRDTVRNSNGDNLTRRVCRKKRVTSLDDGLIQECIVRMFVLVFLVLSYKLIATRARKDFERGRFTVVDKLMPTNRYLTRASVVKLEKLVLLR